MTIHNKAKTVKLAGFLLRNYSQQCSADDDIQSLKELKLDLAYNNIFFDLRLWGKIIQEHSSSILERFDPPKIPFEELHVLDCRI